MIDRRTFLKYTGLAAASAWLGPVACKGSKGISPTGGFKERPNVLLITLDDQNDWCGCLGGHPNAKTPNIDRLADKGVLFSNAHAAATFCEPSRIAMMTGLLPSTSGIYNEQKKLRDVLPDAVTLPQHFLINGYYTLGAGKLFPLADPDPKSWNAYWPSKLLSMPGKILPHRDLLPLNGFSESVIQPSQEPNKLDWGPLAIDDIYTEDGKDVEWVCKQLYQKHSRPFFLSCGIAKPRKNFYVPKKYFDLHPIDSLELAVIKENDLEDVPAIGKSWCLNEDYKLVMKYNKLREVTQAYLAASSFADSLVGRVLDALEKSSYANNTIVVLWSDHGYSLGPKLRLMTTGLWEETTRIPLIIAVPGLTSPGSRCVKPVSAMDIYSTLIDVCDLGEPWRKLDSGSLKTLLINPNGEKLSPAITTYLEGNHAARSERWRYIRYNDGSEELYDHEYDPHEWFNVAKDPEYKTIKKGLSDWMPDD